MTTRQNVRMMFKKAKDSALDKALSAAASIGKPTGTGIASGIGLGTILASIGAMNRATDPAGAHSALSNPLLLGAAGLTGGYLAGNAFNKIPEDKDRSGHFIPSWMSAGAGLTGLGYVGSKVSERDAVDELNNAQKKFRKAVARLRKRMSHGTVEYDISRLGEEAREQFINTKNEYIKALKRNNKYDVLEGLGLEGSKEVNRTADKLLYSSRSPLQAFKAFNPFKESASGGKKALKGINLLGNQLKELLIKSTAKGSSNLKMLPARLAALTAIAGLGKYTYDKITD